MKPFIGVTLGDYNGIGPEVTLKAICSSHVRRICSPVLIGSIEVYEYYAKRLHKKVSLKEVDASSLLCLAQQIPVIEVKQFHHPRIEPGKLSENAGAHAGRAIEEAAATCLNHSIDGMVTAPVSKVSIHAAGYRYPGQTEMLAALTHSKRVMMMLVAGTMRIGLATVHVPLRKVSENLTKPQIQNKISLLDSALTRDFAIKSPKIAVLGLNPHAGENGLIGSEEQDLIQPSIRQGRKKAIRVDGPFPADGFFGSQAYKKYDAILAMYHDQGLIPLKMKGFTVGVNYSAGLSIVRSSPDHGTAFDIAGKGIADPTSMIEAIKLAVMIIKNRKKYS